MENAELWWFLFFADLDECILGIHNCGTEQLCINTPGSFQCSPSQTCPAGFIEDAGSCTGELGIHIKINLALDQRWEVCIWGILTLNLVTFFVLDVNECVAYSSPCLPGETCVNTGGSFLCRKNTVTCGRGYHLSQDGTRCDGTLLPESFFLFSWFFCVCVRFLPWPQTWTSVKRTTCAATTPASTWWAPTAANAERVSYLMTAPNFAKVREGYFRFCCGHVYMWRNSWSPHLFYPS